MSSNSRLLLVTADRVWAEYFARRRGDFVVTAVGRAAEALEELLTGSYDAALVDAQACEIPARVVLRAARRCCPGIRILVVSSAPSVEADAPWIEGGVFYYLAKPAQPGEIEPLLAALGRSIAAWTAPVPPAAGRDPT